MTTILDTRGDETRIPPTQIVRVNAVEITAEAIAEEAQHHPARDGASAWREAAAALAIRELFLQEARRLGVEAAPAVEDGRRETDEEALVRALLEREVRTPSADEPACRRYYDNNAEQFRSADLYEPAHILIAADRRDAPAFEKAIGEVEAILKQLATTPDAFEKIAKQRSDCPSAAMGGRLGQVSEGQTTPEFEAALATLGEGELRATPLETPYGAHAVRLDRKITGDVVPFEAVKHQIAEHLEGRSWGQAARQYVQILAGQAVIEGVDLSASASPLVQ